MDVFEEHRSHLFGVAYRLLGTRADAEDAVQEAWLRYAAADQAAIIDLRGWLITVTGRICLDVLRSARVRRETYIGQWLPEPLVSRPSDEPDPAEAVTLGEDISMALLVVLETLSPEQRAAFVLHDVFGVPFETLAATLGTTPATARQLASRARKAVAEGKARHTADRAEQERVLGAFFAAVQQGDLEGLLAVLAPDVVVTGDSNGLAPAASTPIPGALRVARFMLGLARRGHKLGGYAELVDVNGDLGVLAHDGENPVVMSFAIADGKITAMYDQLNPEKLHFVPELDRTRAIAF
ncbi:RNA polymerase sigma factor SigJ [Longispora fulva]|uniref:RNA polymerase sigma-70 factor (ECF subfamily) n=1 Tax=Longispora fulva TaxID=619741 RepID=A0A8J7GUP4_9ACTN|nr:RNA polymerase sigma factor SigJ [Longispora fulva]MBG6139865.1 RNA polymerase sigma-70 factor (ECF subfamily) [Longispora fulva]GIG57750.1 RNA polymerase sigma factor SigJ [Longispora fulva]